VEILKGIAKAHGKTKEVTDLLIKAHEKWSQDERTKIHADGFISDVAELGEPSSIPFFVRIIEDVVVRKDLVYEALETPETAGKSEGIWAAIDAEQKVQKAMRAIDAIGGPEAKTAIDKFLKSNHILIRVAVNCQKALSLGGEKGIQYLDELLKTEQNSWAKDRYKEILDAVKEGEDTRDATERKNKM